MQTKNILGIDVGASGIKGAIVDIETGELITERIKFETPTPSTPKAVAKVINKLVKTTGYDGNLIGCGFPSIIKHGVAFTAANIDDSWIGTNVEKVLSKSTKRKVLAVNDADAAGLSEMHYGRGKGEMDSVLLITIGSGLGSALFTDGHLVRNTEFGHFYLNGQVAEHYISNTTRKKLDMSWEEFGKRFNDYLEHVERVISPDLIILGGGVSNRFELFSEWITVKTKVTTAEMFNHAGIIGAALYAYENHG
jgi:polyphosphate glucokinase